MWHWAGELASLAKCSKRSTSNLSIPPWQGLLELAKRFPITDVRGRGLMVAAEFGAPDGGLQAPYGIAAKLTKACGKRNMILLSAGADSQSRFKSALGVELAQCDPAQRWRRDAQCAYLPNP